jgi:hypothetical protein
VLAVTAAVAFGIVQLAGTRYAVSKTGTPVSVLKQLGPVQPSAGLVHRPSKGLKVAIHKGGFGLSTSEGAVGLLSASATTGGAWTKHANGATRTTPFGGETVAVTPSGAEQYLTVRKQQGKRTWRWQLTTKFDTRETSTGWVGFFDRMSNRLESVAIPPVQILDARGREITPKGARWVLETTGKQQYLTLTLDDTKLPLPYTIDPGIFRVAASATSVAASGTFTVSIPATANPKDLLLVHETGQATTATATVPAVPTDASGGNLWASITGTNVANATVDQFIFWKWAVAADAGKAVTVTIPGSTSPTVTSATIEIYRGLDSTKASPQTTGATATATAKKLITPAITPSGATTQEHMFMEAGANFNTSTTWSATIVNTTGGTWALQTSTIGSATVEAQASYDLDTAANTAISSTTNAVNNFGGNTNAVTSAFGFSDDVTAPTNSISLTNVSGNAYLAGSPVTGTTGTLYYNTGAAGSFQIQNAVADTGSGPASSTFPALVGGTNWTHTAPATVTTPVAGPYNSGGTPNFFSWATNSSGSPTEAIVGSDNTSAPLTATTTLTFTNDITAPTAAVTFPVNNTHYNSAGWNSTLSGTSADASSSVATVKVSIQKDGGANACWDGTNAAGHFTAACPNYVTASGTTSWTLATLGTGALVDGSSYVLTVETIDNATSANTNTSAASSSFVYDNTAPSSAALSSNGNYDAAGWPGAVTGTVGDSGTGSSGISAVSVSISDSVSGKCWNGGNFTTAGCPNWVAVTSGATATGSANASWSYTLAGSALTDGHTYTVSVRATDATTSGNQSGTLSTASFTYDTTPPINSSVPVRTSGARAASGDEPCSVSLRSLEGSGLMLRQRDRDRRSHRRGRRGRARRRRRPPADRTAARSAGEARRAPARETGDRPGDGSEHRRCRRRR